MARNKTFGGLGDMPHPTITPVKVPRVRMLPSPKTLADVVAKMDELESATRIGADYDLLWMRLRKWIEAHAGERKADLIRLEPVDGTDDEMVAVDRDD
jgi:hypothetical protein